MRALYYILALMVIGYGVNSFMYGGSVVPKAQQHTKTTATYTSTAKPSSYRSGDAHASEDSLKREYGYYGDYEANKVAQELADERAVVFFFVAPWCPGCIFADKTFTNNPTEIPANISVFKVNYDAEKELRERYSVTEPHQFVQLDEQGNSVQTWNGGSLRTLRLMVY